ncbi:MAG: ATP-binding protein [Candidatus Helarchaeota archaeon]
MCEYCLKYGDGHKWYLNPKNFSEEALNSARVKQARIIEYLGGNYKMEFEIGAATMMDALVPDLKNRESIENVSKQVESLHGGQVVPLEEALTIVDLSGGDVIVVPCYCRRHFGGLEDVMTCMFLHPIPEMVPKSRPYEKYLILSKEAAKEKLREFDKIGWVHSVYWAPVPVPIVICNCEYPYCIGLKSRLNYNITNTARKSEYICVVDDTKCDACGGEPKCISRCQFGAIKKKISEGNKVVINPTQCFGCGVCRVVCNRGAMKLIDRSLFPALKDDY